MAGLVNRPNDISLSRASQSQAKFKSAVGGNLLQSWVNLPIVSHCWKVVPSVALIIPCSFFFTLFFWTYC